MKRFEYITESTSEALSAFNNAQSFISKLSLAKATNPQARKRSAHAGHNPLRPCSAFNHPAAICQAHPPLTTGPPCRPLSLSQPIATSNRFGAFTAPSTDDEVSFDPAEGSSQYASMEHSQDDWSQVHSGDWDSTNE